MFLPRLIMGLRPYVFSSFDDGMQRTRHVAPGGMCWLSGGLWPYSLVFFSNIFSIAAWH